MTMAPSLDLLPAAWLVGSTLAWDRLVCFGPAGFEAYARLRFLPDPAYPGQREADAGASPQGPDQLATLLGILAAHTRTPGECYFCLWNGWSDLNGSGTRLTTLDQRGSDSGRAAGAAFPPSVLAGPKVVVPNRSYLLFRGDSTDPGDWGAADVAPGHPRLWEPAFVWPADRAWCVANDVDPHWAGIGADRRVIEQLVADPRLDVVPADPDEKQPGYR